MHAREWGWVETSPAADATCPTFEAQPPDADGRRADGGQHAIQGRCRRDHEKAMIDCDRALRESGSPPRVLLQVHDELVVEVPATICRRGSPGRSAMADATRCRSLVVDVKIGDNWQEMTPMMPELPRSRPSRATCGASSWDGASSAPG